MKIVQILPADGWFAEFKTESGQPFQLHKIAFWALLDTGEIRGVMATHKLEFAEDSEGLAYRYRP